MSTLIVYASKYGTTKKCAHILGDKLHDHTDFFELGRNITKDLSPFDTIIIGGPIYMGKIRKKVTACCEMYSEVLDAQSNCQENSTRLFGLF